MPFRQREHRCANCGGIRPRRRFGIAGGDEIPIGQWSSEQNVADCAANEPDVVAREGLTDRRNCSGQAGIRLVGHPTT
jgi:hypothetical protein